jgi:hypothetical protein
VDFTSAPRKRKPITCAWARLSGGTLDLHGFEQCADFETFQALLTRDERWIGAFDMPFGLPRAFVAEQGWPARWRGYTRAALALSRKELVQRCRAYAAAREPGSKLAYRATDKPAGSSSAMWWMNPPVVLMYHAGVRELLAAKVRIEPCHRIASNRVAVEAYPGLIQKRLGIGSYKQDIVGKQTQAQRDNRGALLNAITGCSPEWIGCTVKLKRPQIRAMVNDGSGDTLDAFLCVLQAAFAYLRCNDGFGFPARVPASEGWIVMA